MLVRLIILAALVWFGLKLYRRYRLKQDSVRRRQAAPTLRNGGTMVRCAYCRLHLPQQDAVAFDSRWFCCPQHRQQFLAHGPSQRDKRP